MNKYNEKIIKYDVAITVYMKYKTGLITIDRRRYFEVKKYYELDVKIAAKLIHYHI